MSSSLNRSRVPRGTHAAIGLAVLGAFSIAAPPSSFATSPCSIADPLSLGVALRCAAQVNPALAVQRAEVEAARARLSTARLFLEGPEIELGVGRRRGSAGRSIDREVRVSQTFEIGGQRQRRHDVAAAELAAAEAELERQQRQLRAQVALAFVETLRARQLREIAELDAELTQGFLDLTSRRLEAGAATLLDVNLARATRGRSERQLALALGAELSARGLVAEAIGIDLEELPEIAEEPPALVSETPLPQLGELLRRARLERFDLEAFRLLRGAAEASVRLARAERRPDLGFGIGYGREEGDDEILSFGLSLALPVYGQARGATLEARAISRRAAFELAAAQRAAERQVATAYAALVAASEAAEVLQEQVVSSAEETLGLLGRSFETGKIGASELLLFRRELIESQRDAIETLADAGLARITLDLAVGGPVAAWGE